MIITAVAETSNEVTESMSYFSDDACIRRVFVSKFDLKVNERQFIGAHLELVVGPQHSRHSTHTERRTTHLQQHTHR